MTADRLLVLLMKLHQISQGMGPVPSDMNTKSRSHQTLPRPFGKVTVGQNYSAKVRVTYCEYVIGTQGRRSRLIVHIPYDADLGGRESEDGHH